jgi:ABC-type Fe3+/spermidine/putrescine transport system ATPase subunit
VTAPLLSIRNVSKRLGSHQVLDGVSLDIGNGQAVAVLGPSGAGKTTLLRLIAGLDIPDDGEIWISGMQVAAARQSLVAPYERGIGYVFQDLALWPHLTVREHLEFVLGSMKVARGKRANRIQETLELARIPVLGARYPHQLSGGEQQRVALARALVGHPRLLLMDEPLSSLDPDLRAAVREELALLQQSMHVTTLYVTHDRQDASILADHIIEMRSGHVASRNANARSVAWRSDRSSKPP